MDTNYIPPYKKNRYYNHHHHFKRRQLSVLPSKFLLGGNINDPLNLNSLGDIDNAKTPKTSPMPVPQHRVGEIPIFIPKNPTDPLGLQNCEEEDKRSEIIEDVLSGEAAQPNPATTKSSRKRHRRKSLRNRNDSECSVESVGDTAEGGNKVGLIEVETSAEQYSKDNKNGGEKGAASAKDVHITADQKPPCDDLPSSSSQTAGSHWQKSQNVDPSSVSTLEQPRVPINDRPSISTKDSERSVGNEDSGGWNMLGGSSEYIPLSSRHQPSPFILHDDALGDNFEMATFPFESPSLLRFVGSQHLGTEPFSPPTHSFLGGRRIPAGHYSYDFYVDPSAHVSNASSRGRHFQLYQPSQRSYFRRRFRNNKLDPIVSPVIPQPGKKRPRYQHFINSNNQVPNTKKVPPDSVKECVDNSSGNTTAGTEEAQRPKVGKEKTKNVKTTFRKKDEEFRFGNYNRYYGYRVSPVDGSDVRLKSFNMEWFEGKDILDIGCNVGHVTLSIARDFGPRRVVGIDIDGGLVKVAQKNIKHYINRDPKDVEVQFPQSLPIQYGPLQPFPQLEADSKSSPKEEATSIPFPYNVRFYQDNYVLETEEQLGAVKPEYDVILCLSVTKWVHLNFGDSGLKRFFRRAFLNLRPGGMFILEPQPWSSYRRKKNLTQEIHENFKGIKFFPDDFQKFLIKDVGYEFVEIKGTAPHHIKGFQRQLFVFTKSKVERK